MNKIKGWVTYYKENRSAINFWYALCAAAIGFIIGNTTVLALAALLIAVEAFVRIELNERKQKVTTEKGADNA